MPKQSLWFLHFGTVLSVDQTAALIAQKLTVVLEKHESSYVGIYFLAKLGKTYGHQDSQMVVRKNFDPTDGDLFEPDHPLFDTLIQISTVGESDALKELVKELGWTEIRRSPSKKSS